MGCQRLAMPQALMPYCCESKGIEVRDRRGNDGVSIRNENMFSKC